MPSPRGGWMVVVVALGLPGVGRGEPFPAPQTPAEAEKLWDELASGSSVRANEAIWALASAPEQAVALARQKVQPAGDVERGAVERWVRELDHDRFAARQQATQRLHERLDMALPELQRALTADLSLEKRRRVERLLESWEHWRQSPERVRTLSIVLVLQHAGTAGARQMLQSLAAGAPEAELTDAAQRALRRMHER